VKLQAAVTAVAHRSGADRERDREQQGSEDELREPEERRDADRDEDDAPDERRNDRLRTPKTKSANAVPTESASTRTPSQSRGMSATRAMRSTTSVISVMKANPAAMPSHIAARLFAARISAISWRGSSSCLRI